MITKPLQSTQSRFPYRPRALQTISISGVAVCSGRIDINVVQTLLSSI